MFELVFLKPKKNNVEQKHNLKSGRKAKIRRRDLKEKTRQKIFKKKTERIDEKAF